MANKGTQKVGKIVDDKFEHLERDIDKLRQKHRMYISASNEVAAKNLVLEILYNSVDECRNPRSPGDKITIEFDERSGFIKITDNGRGIPTDILEMILTTLNSGSNIDSGAKEDLKTNVLGRNGTGTIAYTALAERVEVTSYRGGSENKFRRLVFVEGDKVEDKNGSCAESKHGMEVVFKPSKILGRNTRIVWNDVYQELINFQYLETKKMNITSDYIDKDGNNHHEKYHVQDFKNIISHNDKDNLISDIIEVSVADDNIKEEFGGRSYKRFIDMKVAFAYTKNLHPYIDSFCNGNNTFDNGSHMDGSVEALCRYFQGATKNSMSEKEKERLDVKWDDVKTGLSIAVVLNSNMEQLFTNQTKQKIDNRDLEKMIRDKLMEVLQAWGERNPNQLKEIIGLVKTNAKVRREGDKVRNAVIKESVTNWKSFQMKNYDPCSNRGKEYKELYIIEGDSAKGSLKLARYPKFQALFAVRGVSANAFKLDLSGVLANREFNDLIKVMGCNVGAKFDINKLAFDKIIIATDADVDGLFIRTLLLGFFFKIFPEIIQDGRIFIAEPPLYRVKDKKNPFVINNDDYINRYINDVVKSYRVGIGDLKKSPVFMNKTELREFLSDTSSYTDDIEQLARHYKINEYLVEIILYQFGLTGMKLTEEVTVDSLMKNLDIQKLMTRINEDFPELRYNDEHRLIAGSIDGKYQSIEITERIVRKGMNIIRTFIKYECQIEKIIMQENKTNVLNSYPLLTALKILKKYQPEIEHYFKGLGENMDDDLRYTIMDPNTRMLIRINIADIENDMRIFSVLRGGSASDMKARKELIRKYEIPVNMIST